MTPIMIKRKIHDYSYVNGTYLRALAVASIFGQSLSSFHYPSTTDRRAVCPATLFIFGDGVASV